MLTGYLVKFDIILKNPVYIQCIGKYVSTELLNQGIYIIIINLP